MNRLGIDLLMEVAGYMGWHPLSLRQFKLSNSEMILLMRKVYLEKQPWGVWQFMYYYGLLDEFAEACTYDEIWHANDLVLGRAFHTHNPEILRCKLGRLRRGNLITIMSYYRHYLCEIPFCEVLESIVSRLSPRDVHLHARGVLMLVCKKQNLRAAEIIYKAGLGVESLRVDDNILLEKVSIRGLIKTARWLVSKGITGDDVDECDALVYACSGKHIKLIQLFVGIGADVESVINRNPYLLARKYSRIYKILKNKNE